MKILVISDTHKKTTHVHNLIQSGNYDMLLHLGDCYDDFLELKSVYDMPMTGVKGNVDYDSEGLVEENLIIKGKKVLLTHGHRYRVKNSLHMIKAYGDQMGYDLVLFGHTHKAFHDDDTCILFNPGSVSKPMDDYPTYGEITIDDSIKCEIKYIK